MFHKISIFLIGLLFSPLLGFAQTIHLVTEPHSPFAYISPAGKIDGIIVQKVTRLFQKANIDFTLNISPWEKSYALALTTPNYAVFPTAKTSARERFFKWVGPIYTDTWVFLAMKNSSIHIQQLQDAQKYTIGTYRGDFIVSYLQEHGINNLKLALTNRQNATRLQKGEINLWASSLLTGTTEAKNANINVAPVYTIKKVDLYIAFNQTTPQAVINHLNEVLANMR